MPIDDGPALHELNIRVEHEQYAWLRRKRDSKPRGRRVSISEYVRRLIDREMKKEAAENGVYMYHNPTPNAGADTSLIDGVRVVPGERYRLTGLGDIDGDYP